MGFYIVLTRNLNIAWAVTVAIFTAIGVVYGIDLEGAFSIERLAELTVAFGAGGIGVASCIVGGLAVVRTFRLRRSTRRCAVTQLLVSSAAGMLLPALVFWVACLAFHLFQEEHGWIYFGVLLCLFWIDLATFLIFAICLFVVKRC